MTSFYDEDTNPRFVTEREMEDSFIDAVATADEVVQTMLDEAAFWAAAEARGD